MGDEEAMLCFFCILHNLVHFSPPFFILLLQHERPPSILRVDLTSFSPDDITKKHSLLQILHVKCRSAHGK